MNLSQAQAGRRHRGEHLAQKNVQVVAELLCDAVEQLSNADRVGPEKRKKLKGLIDYYRKMAHPFTSCVTADTMVDAPRDLERDPDGVRIDSLRKGDLVWSFDEGERVFKLKPIAWAEMTRHNAELVAVLIDNGKTIRCTPDHPFLLRNGRWMDAGRLRSGDSLMPLYRDFEPRVRLRPDRPGYTAEHDVVAEAAYGSVEGLHVHHADRRRANVSIENIEALTGNEHAAAHHRQWDEAVALRNEEWRCPSCDELFTPTSYNQKKCSSCQGYQKLIVDKMASCERCDAQYQVCSPNHRYCSSHCRSAARSERRVRGESAEHLRGAQPATWNHKVISVTTLDEREDVWDIEVMDTHTFVAHGVVLHNCVNDNTKRFGPERAKKVCAVLTDIEKGTTKWRNGGSKKVGMTLAEQPLDSTVDRTPVIDDELFSLLSQIAETDYKAILGLETA